ncbi:MAG: sensor domain-containing diguanylate cyclase [Aquabacterium sp.]|nr:sensor domain-containing diguanylate cyclase [Aquabacterium sp.]
MPINEVLRVQAVRAHHIIDTPPEAAFDAITRLASHAFGTPVALLTLIDADRLWIKSSVGPQLGDIARASAICAHTLIQPDKFLVVQDLATDQRFAHNPWLTAPPHLRFYAGAALIDAQGHALGTVAILDTQPRRFGATHVAALQDLATMAMVTLQGRSCAHQMAQLIVTDQLTGLSNRTQFSQALEVELAHAMRTGEPFTALRMDLDGFKEVREGFGHAASDEVLCEVSRRLRQQVRLGDVLARFDSDEFGVVMRHGAHDSAQVLAKRIVKAVSAPITLSTGDVIGVGISIGMAAYTDKVESVPILLAQAEQALYQSKKQNEKRWKMFVGIR